MLQVTTLSSRTRSLDLPSRPFRGAFGVSNATRRTVPSC